MSTDTRPAPPLDSPPIACIGGGNMARALIGGWLARGLDPARICVADPSAECRAQLARSFPGVRTVDDNGLAAASADVWVLAVKPQLLGPVARALAPVALERRPLAISVAAGIRLQELRRWLGPGARVVRTMPNRPALIGAGITALHADAGLPVAARELAGRLMEAVGRVVWVGTEPELDAVTAVSGSGPAYFFLLIELLEAAAIRQGLAPEVARVLALETAAGAARLARESSDDPATLRASVTSKGGTTAAALAVMEAADLRGIVARAVEAATVRSRELAADFAAD